MKRRELIKDLLVASSGIVLTPTILFSKITPEKFYAEIKINNSNFANLLTRFAHNTGSYSFEKGYLNSRTYFYSEHNYSPTASFYDRCPMTYRLSSLTFLDIINLIALEHLSKLFYQYESELNATNRTLPSSRLKQNVQNNHGQSNSSSLIRAQNGPVAVDFTKKGNDYGTIEVISEDWSGFDTKKGEINVRT